MKQPIGSRIRQILLACMLALPLAVQAFETVGEQIAYYQDLLERGSYSARFEMLERLQWSGLSDPRLFDSIEALVLAQYQESSFNKNDRYLVSYAIRALGYSGNEKYRATLEEVRENARIGKLRGYAKRALRDMNNFRRWHAKIDASDFSAEGKPVEVAMYMKMLDVDDPEVQRLAARAIFHEKQSDPDLLTTTADLLKREYLRPGLTGDEQDMAAWLCKALGENAPLEYGDFLRTVADDTPHRKIRKYADKYAR